MKMFCFVILLLFLKDVTAQSPHDKLKEAKDYLTVNPAHSLTILQAIPNINALSVKQQIQWHIITMRASVPTDNPDMLIDSLEAIFYHYQHPYFIENLTTITSALGIWLRKNNHLIEAQTSLECSYKHAKNDRQKLTLTNSLALVARHIGDLDTAKALYNEAKKIAKLTQRDNVLAIIENNQGMIALEEGNIALAEQHFRLALVGYQNLDKRSGQISAGLNLLFTFLIQQELVNFQRLYSPTKNLTNGFSSVAKQALLLWLHTRFLQLQGEPITAKEQRQLKIAYSHIKGPKLKMLINKYLAPALDFKHMEDPTTTQIMFNRPWFKHVQDCSWPKQNKIH
ncbi:tetratricopeptide repeat protein [Pseudoalteromonas sp. MMG012]|uniref:tetratricopeptide repeat protein n=1 Tax=Pseudoalteromonas sp. MMG012 TaxID=2822686 RepID=UPI001B3A11FF|nr:tetratricopeptide repeat protein [Pseudoalteromonas sp. MMG012]MBQ4852906.1 tetratricopeptide repeat protein [Pseudoalteromonas sp. MMG012]